MSKKIFKCKKCQQEYDNLKNWEVKKRVALENGSYHTEICCMDSYSKDEIAKYCQECKNIINILSNECGDHDPNWKHNQEECLSLQGDKQSNNRERERERERERAELPNYELKFNN